MTTRLAAFLVEHPSAALLFVQILVFCCIR